VDILDHADHMDDEVIERVVAQGVFVLPSLYFLTDGYEDRSPQRLEQVDRWLRQAATVLPRAQAAGVKLVTGDDFGTKRAPHGDNGKELAVYVNRLGLSARDVIVWATKNGADMMRKGDEFGTITAGKLADLLVVDGDPVADITLLGNPANLAVVMQDGRFVTNRLNSAH
jgi:imidazolonepropionase-like amidohydrolase